MKSLAELIREGIRRGGYELEEDSRWSIWPVVYFEADWPKYKYDFGQGILLVKAVCDPDGVYNEDEEEVPEEPPDEEIVSVLDNTKWCLLVLHRKGHSDRNEQLIAETFLLCLRLVQPTCAILPISCSSAPIAPNFRCVSDIKDYRTYFRWRSTDKPFAERILEPFERGDLILLQRLWLSVIKLIRKYVKEMKPKGLDELVSNRTRIGRALNLFYEGLELPKLHSFLSMCLVLETLFTVEKAEITYQFATRLANITGKTLEQRKDIFERARNVYEGRSNIVHGRKSIETIESDILKDAFLFARQSIRHILLDPTLLKLYSDPITSDKTKEPDKAIKAIKEYFRDLDLRCG